MSLDRHQISRITGMPLTEQKQAIEAKVAEVIAQLNASGRLPEQTHLLVPNVSYDLTGTVAGYATGRYNIRINTSLLHTNWEEMLNVTVPHEVAHCVVQQVWGNRGIKIKSHGQQWQWVMALLGLPAQRCHDMQITKTRKHPRKYVYDCGQCEHNLTLNKHNKIQKKNAQYVCNASGNYISKDSYIGEKQT